jgi:hypothetical protein
MKALRFLLSFTIGLLMAVIVGSAVAFGLGTDPWTSIGVAAVAVFIPKGMPSGVLAMAVQKEIWVQHIIGNLFKNNEFLNFAFNADQYVLQGKVVHIPQAAAAPNVSKNRDSLPATVVKRADTDVTYALDEYTTDPVLIPNADQYELSYDKRESVLAESEATLRQTISDWMLRNWAPSAAGSKVRTSGADIAAHAPDATGERKKIVTADFKTIAKKFNNWNIPMEERFALLDGDMYDQLLDSFSETTYRDFSKVVDPAKGIVGELYGFKVMQRSGVLYYDSALAPKDPDDEGATTDFAAALFWQKNAVERALGMVEFFEQLKAPEYFGDIYSLLVRMGGRIRRTDSKGVVALIQDAPAT